MNKRRPVIAAHYAEIALKGKNRRVFLHRLKINMEAALKGEPVESINHVESRLLVRMTDLAAAERAADKLQRVFGIQNLSLAMPVPRGDDPAVDLENVAAAARRLALRDIGDARSFRIDCRRSDRDFPFNSQQINTSVGDVVGAALTVPVRLTDPDFSVFLLVLKKEILIFTQKLPGGGGLPVGSSGRVMSLLSGGIDSPVATWMLMKRGCRPELIHFYSGRSFAEAEPDKIVRLAQGLARWAPRPLKLHMIPAVPYETRSIGTVDDAYDMLLFRRYMVLTAARMARRRDCLALVTGDSVGQVASQTLPNLNAISPDVRIPILRPLVGLDKIEITALSRRIGVFETSIEPYRDCCSIRSPRPMLNARPETLLEMSETMGMEEAVQEAMAASVRLVVGPDGRLD